MAARLLLVNKLVNLDSRLMIRFIGITRTMPHPMTAAYNASKAALSQYSNTLRLELEPMDIKVIELVTGRVSTGLITVPSLDDVSFYKPLEPALQSRAKEAGICHTHRR